MQGTPHGIVANLLEDVAGGAKSVGATVAGALDTVPGIVGVRGPHNIGAALLDGTVDSWLAFGRGVKKALDQPLDDLGIPLGGMRLPW